MQNARQKAPQIPAQGLNTVEALSRTRIDRIQQAAVYRCMPGRLHGTGSMGDSL